MNMHPAIAKILARPDLDPAYRQAVERANAADLKARSYQGPGHAHGPETEDDILAAMHADLLIHGMEEINGMKADLWLARNLRRDKERNTIAQLVDVMECQNIWLEGALQCKDWHWDPPQWDAADQTLKHARELVEQFKTTPPATFKMVKLGPKDKAAKGREEPGNHGIWFQSRHGRWFGSPHEAGMIQQVSVHGLTYSFHTVYPPAPATKITINPDPVEPS